LSARHSAVITRSLKRVDDLRAFEREYRIRLEAYLEGQLRDLRAGGGGLRQVPCAI